MTPLAWIWLAGALSGVSASLVALMIRVGALDHPVARSSHIAPTPKGGGVGIVAAYVAGLVWIAWHDRTVGLPVLMTAPPALILGVISYLDDVFDWPFTAKLAAQAAAALGVVAGGIWLNTVALPPPDAWLWPPAWLGVLVTLGWMLFVTNAVNFMDGLNGLASGSVAVCALALAVRGSAGDEAMCLPLIAGIAGFLPFNFPRARIFMGDVGSQVCGFVVAVLAVRGAGEARVSAVVPLALAPMLLDAAFTLVRRARAGQRLTQAHRGHLYQVANRAGLRPAVVTIIYWSMAALDGGAGLAAGGAGAGTWPMLGAVGLACAMFGVWAAYVARLAARAGLTLW